MIAVRERAEQKSPSGHKVDIALEQVAPGNASGNVPEVAMPSFPGGILRYGADPALKQPPDVALCSAAWWYDYLALPFFRDSTAWRAMLIEFVGTTLLVFMSCAIVVSVLTANPPFSNPPAAISIAHGPLIAFFIFAAATASGAHLNPLITLSTMLVGLTKVSRGSLYICAQCAGSALGASLLRGVVGETIANATFNGGCLLGPLPAARGVLSETVFSLALLFIAFGTALDPKQGLIYGPVLAPFFISVMFALILFASSFMPGYTGPSINPARCFGPAVAMGDLSNHWVPWVGVLIASSLHALLYYLVPPDHEIRRKELKVSVLKANM